MGWVVRGVLLGLVVWPGLVLGQAPSAPVRSVEPARRLPADVTTKHSVEMPGRTLRFTATAGSVVLADAGGVGQAQIAYISYSLDDVDVRRPVSFAFNGGPGSASAWVHLGLLGPWRMPMDGDAARPSAAAVPLGNAETWLDFTDLVFVDPVGTGFSRLLNNSEENRKKYWSVGGDVAADAEAIRMILQKAGRMTSPKYVVGESYGGLRGPRLVRELASSQGVGVAGLVLISPKMDYGGNSTALEPLGWVAQLPTMVASEPAKQGPVTRAQMADVEAYASGEYLVDLVRGEHDPAAVARRIAHVQALTGLDPAVLERRHGLMSNAEFFRAREPGRVASPYDTTVSKPDPFPQAAWPFLSDPLTDALEAPITSAMLELYSHTLNWQPDGGYTLLNRAANRAWDYGQSYTRPESVSSLRAALALDPRFHVLIAHGLFDLVTPYFMTQMQLDQIPPGIGVDRIRLEVYPGGHMFYSRDASRAAFREAAEALYAGR